jgi:glutamine synthetase
MRLEYRPTDGSCNFYLAYAGLISAGLDGLNNKLTPPEPVEANIYDMDPQERLNKGISILPGNLGEALSELEQDGYFQDVLGSNFIQKYLDIKKEEWKKFSVYVHEWERNMYLDV